MSEIQPQQRVNYVRLTNNLPFSYVDRYDGVPYYVVRGDYKDIPIDAAMHLLGFNPAAGTDPESQQQLREGMFRHISRRLGWNSKEYLEPILDARGRPTGKTKARDFFEKLTIEPISYKLVRDDGTVDPKAPIPADAGSEED